MEPVQTPFTEILVPLDGSPAAERALRPACALATRTGAPIRLLQRPTPSSAMSGRKTLRSHLREYPHRPVARGRNPR